MGTRPTTETDVWAVSADSAYSTTSNSATSMSGSCCNVVLVDPSAHPLAQTASSSSSCSTTTSCSASSTTPGPRSAAVIPTHPESMQIVGGGMGKVSLVEARRARESVGAIMEGERRSAESPQQAPFLSLNIGLEGTAKRKLSNRVAQQMRSRTASDVENDSTELDVLGGSARGDTEGCLQLQKGALLDVKDPICARTPSPISTSKFVKARFRFSGNMLRSGNRSSISTNVTNVNNVNSTLAGSVPSLGMRKKKGSCPILNGDVAWNNVGSMPAGVGLSKKVEFAVRRGVVHPQRALVFGQPVAPERAASGDPPGSGSAHRSPSCPQFGAMGAESCGSMSARYKLIVESGPVPICRVEHNRSITTKLPFLRRWESHVLRLTAESLRSVHRRMFRFRKLAEDPPQDVCTLLREINYLVDSCLRSRLIDDALCLEPVKIVTAVIEKIFAGVLNRALLEPVVIAVVPLLETISAVAEICPHFSKICLEMPRSRLVDEVFIECAAQTLKKNMDFSKFPSTRLFIQDLIGTLYRQRNDGNRQIRTFVSRVHTEQSVCPHSRVLPNLSGACLAAIHAMFETDVGQSQQPMLVIGQMDKCDRESRCSPTPSNNPPIDDSLLEAFCLVFAAAAEFDDWRPSLAALLQPLPWPEKAVRFQVFSRTFHTVVGLLAGDPRCEVHQAVLAMRPSRAGWFDLYCPGGACCRDDGSLFALMLDCLLNCCCKRKWFIELLNGMLGPLQLLALRECEPALLALCHMLEMEVVTGSPHPQSTSLPYNKSGKQRLLSDGDDLSNLSNSTGGNNRESAATAAKLQVVATLQSTAAGRRHYGKLCDRRVALRELQQRGGPRKLTLPSKSTDGDLAVLLSSGSFGNLEWLSLAFTNVTQDCADYLIRLPSLRYLNLWSTQFGDAGVQLISENLHKLQVLNLCETPVTDKAMRSLRKLNLNSTRLSASTFKLLKDKLPSLQEVDIRYTEAWCADDESLPIPAVQTQTSSPATSNGHPPRHPVGTQPSGTLSGASVSNSSAAIIRVSNNHAHSALEH